ncbi:MAG: hypothetical protein EAX96_08840 [Candidatus Lokiarchaeota archaeon]|nr:hypothetical protein [Candidatus Lokiarchaeota archaeon]
MERSTIKWMFLACLLLMILFLVIWLIAIIPLIGTTEDVYSLMYHPLFIPVIIFLIPGAILELYLRFTRESKEKTGYKLERSKKEKNVYKEMVDEEYKSLDKKDDFETLDTIKSKTKSSSKIKMSDIDEIDMMRVPDMSEIDQNTYELLEAMTVKKIKKFLEDSRKEITNHKHEEEISAWIKKLKKYPNDSLFENDLKKLSFDFNRW